MKAVKPVIVSDSILTSNVPVDDAPAWVASQTGVAGDRVVYERMVYELLIDGDWGTTPPGQGSAAVPRWLLIGPVNKWKMFNKRAGNKWLVGQFTSNPDSIDVTISPGVIVNSIGLVGVSAVSVQIIMTTTSEGEVYNETFEMTSRGDVRNWYQHWFNEFTRKTSLVSFDLPSYGNAEVQVIVSNPGQDARVGTLVIGAMRPLGDTLYGSGISYNSRSTTNEDVFGNVEIVSRGSIRTNEFDVVVDRMDAASVIRFLDSVRDEPTLYVGDEDDESTIAIGWLRSYPAVIANPSKTTLNIEVRNLE